MNQKTDKIASYIGFALRSRQCVTGCEQIARVKKKILVLFLSRDAAPNTAKDIRLKSEREKIPLIVPQHENLSELVHKTNCKVAGITDKELAKSILENINENYILTGGVN